MSFSTLILEFLKDHAEVSVADFGTFYLKNTNAIVETDRKSILPPGKEVAFSDRKEIINNTFASYLASQKSISLAEAEAEIQRQVAIWKSTLEKEGTLSVENLGTFSLNNSEINFIGERLNNAAPDFYGLEEINLAEIKNPSPKNKESGKSYQTSKTWYWLVAVLLAACAIAYLSLEKPESIFGKKSFPNANTEQTKAKTPVKVAKKDSAPIYKAADSTKTDSAAANIPKNNKTN